MIDNNDETMIDMIDHRDDVLDATMIDTACSDDDNDFNITTNNHELSCKTVIYK